MIIDYYILLYIFVSMIDPKAKIAFKVVFFTILKKIYMYIFDSN